MVLRSPFKIFALVALLGAACLPRASVQRLSEPKSVAVAFVLDREPGPGVAEVPAALKARLTQELARRNLELREVPFERYGQSFGAVRDSRRRYEALRTLGGEAPLLLLVEAKASFFSQISGRYRWMVYVRLTAGRAEGGEPAESVFDLPTFVDFDHEREAAVLGTAAPAIAERAGGLFDGLLAPATVGSAPDADAIYFVMVDRFANGDPANDGAIDLADPAAFHGGDLQGLIGRLDELYDLGVRTVWLSPVFKTRTEKFFGHGAFHGYWVEDLREVEPRFGTREQLEALSAKLRNRGMRLLMDMVLNHVGPDAPLSEERPEWFHGKGPLTDWSDPEQLVSHDVHGLPDLAQEREDVYRYLLESSAGWIREVRPHGFRLDAVKHLPLSFWARYNQDLRREAGGSLVLLGEMLDGDPQVLARTQREGRFSAMFDFPLYYALIDVFCRDQPPTRLAAVLSQDRLYPDPLSLVTLLDNHDLPRVMSDCGGDEERVRQALSVQLTARGTPSLTYGTEAGLTGEREPDNRGDMRFTASPLKEHIRGLLALRRRHPALQRGAPLVLAATDDLFAYARVTAEDAVVIAVNRGGSAARIPLPSGEGKGEGTLLEIPPRSTKITPIAPRSPQAFDALAARLDAQWRSGAQKREVELEAAGLPEESVFVVGSAPELGGWNPGRGLGPLDERGIARAALPVGSVYEYKLVVRPSAGAPRWEAGANRSLFVREGEGPMRVKVSFRGS